MKCKELHSGLDMCGSLLIILLAGCSDAVCIEESDELLPPEKYPIEIEWTGEDDPEDLSASRILTDRNAVSCYWQEGDQIGIQVQGGGNDAETVGMFNKELRILNTGLFWKTKSPSILTAWYPAENQKVSLTDQSKGLKYILKAEPIEKDYTTGPIRFVFHHQLAKVRITLKETVRWRTNATLYIKGFSACQTDKGNITTKDEQKYIRMQHIRSRRKIYEATVIPMEIEEGEEILKVSYYIFNKSFSPNRSVRLEAGKVYNFTIDTRWFR